MTQELAIAYIRKRATELRQGDQYNLRFRHYVLPPLGEQRITGGTALFVLVDPPPHIRVEGETALFDLTETAVNELQYEFQGIFDITNYSPSLQHVQMIQVIFKNETQCHR